MADRNDEDDRDAFRAAVRDVKPLRHAPRAAAARAAPITRRPRSARARPAADSFDASMPLLAVPADDADVPAGDIAGATSLAFQRAGVRTQVVRRLRRGLYPVSAQLDLHGMTQSAARERLAEFIASSRDAGHRCVRIIHGKGYRSGARGPILKVAVDSWLRRHLDVMAFVSAKPIDGGTGALYVLLRA